MEVPPFSQKPIMPRLLFQCSYLGHHFRGWQSQVCGTAAQDAVERACRKLLGEGSGLGVTKRVSASGRTDAGVHALRQYFHLDIPEDNKLSHEAWRAALNANLPAQLRINEVREVTSDFHARYSAKEKTYLYRMERAEVLSPFDLHRFWHVRRGLDMSLLHEAMQCFVGEHDFRHFAVNRGNEPQPIPEGFYTRIISSVELREVGSQIDIHITGNGFLYKMVRLMVGTAHQIAKKRMSMDSLRDMLALAPAAEKSRYCAPPEGLYLEEVMY